MYSQSLLIVLTVIAYSDCRALFNSNALEAPLPPCPLIRTLPPLNAKHGDNREITSNELHASYTRLSGEWCRDPVSSPVLFPSQATTQFRRERPYVRQRRNHNPFHGIGVEGGRSPPVIFPGQSVAPFIENDLPAVSRSDKRNFIRGLRTLPEIGRIRRS